MSDDDGDEDPFPAGDDEDAEESGFGFGDAGDGRENGDGPQADEGEEGIDGADGEDGAGSEAPAVSDEGAPLDDLVERTRAAGEAPDDEVMDAFDDVSVDGVEGEALWNQLEQGGVEEAVDEPATDSERDVRVVRKRDYCMRCQFFSAPPEVRCTHERGEILEMVDTDRFKLADCPILRGEEELENLRR